jgi:NhaP-type Na+/H+ or K+/H+ antiporter
MAYGGLRGAIAFSMVEMLGENTVTQREMFVTTTLTVIIFTVFIQVTYLV